MLVELTTIRFVVAVVAPASYCLLFERADCFHAAAFGLVALGFGLMAASRLGER